MNQLMELQQKKTALLAQITLIHAKRDSTPAGEAEFAAAEAEIETVNRSIDREIKFAALTGNAIADNNRTEVRDNALAKPFGPEPRANESARDKKARLEQGFGEQLLAIKNAVQMPHRIDGRLLEINKRAALGASEAVPADGSFLVAPDFASEILTVSHDTGQVFNRCRKVPLSETTNSIKIPGIDESSRVNGSRWGGIQMYWQNEADATTATKPKFRQIELITKKLMGLFYSTDELLSDARALGSIVTQGFGEELGFKLDDAVINGDGAGKPQGIMNSDAKIAIAKETGQATLTVLFQNVIKMWSRLHGRSRKNAVWFLNQDVEQQLLQMSLAVGTGGSSVVTGVAPSGPSVYTPAGFNGNETGMLFGRPVVAIEQCASLSTEGDIILFDPTQYVYVDKGDVQQATSMHVAFLTDQMAFRWIYRVDGQPVWHKALTPFKGSSTQSPYITLAAR